MRGKKMDGFPTREQALKDFFESWSCQEEIEYIPLEEAAWRVTARALHSVNTLPVVRSSACDGIAVDAARFAGGVPDYTGWKLGEDFVRADTGDDFDDRFDAVIPIEEADLEGDRLVFLSPDLDIKPGSNVNPRGSTIQEGELLVGANLPLRPVDLAALAMGGIAVVPVRKRPKVAFLPTGSELVPPQVRPARGQNVDTNSVMVRHQLVRMGAEPLIFPITSDDPEALRRRLREALAMADLVILNAGTARGGEDFSVSLLEEEGKLIHHYVSAAPGRPMALAVIDGKPVINLPGPSLAAFFGMNWCVRAVINRFLHLPMQRRPRIRGVLMEDIRTNPNMAILCKLRVEAEDGEYRFYPLSFHSGTMPQCLTSSAMYVSDVGESLLEKGTVIEAELLRDASCLEGGE